MGAMDIIGILISIMQIFINYFLIIAYLLVICFIASQISPRRVAPFIHLQYNRACYIHITILLIISLVYIPKHNLSYLVLSYILSRYLPSSTFLLPKHTKAMKKTPFCKHNPFSPTFISYNFPKFRPCTTRPFSFLNNSCTCKTRMMTLADPGPSVSRDK